MRCTQPDTAGIIFPHPYIAQISLRAPATNQVFLLPVLPDPLLTRILPNANNYLHIYQYQDGLSTRDKYQKDIQLFIWHAHCYINNQHQSKQLDRMFIESIKFRR